MQKKFKKFLAIVLFFFVSLFLGYEHPYLIEVPKKNIKFLLKKINLIDNFALNKEEIRNAEMEKNEETNQDDIIIEGNSFDLVLNKKINFDDRTAGLFIENFNNQKFSYDLYLQNGLMINNEFTKELFLPKDIDFNKNGGVKAVFEINQKKYVLYSNFSNNCRYATILEIDNQEIILKTKCLPDLDNVDFNGLGGGIVENKDKIYISIGAPEWNSRNIRKLAQDRNYFYGKIIQINKITKELQIFSLGHKNPQGLAFSEDKLFAIEHGPQGGDEINLIKKNGNYGWPITSYGTEYNNGESFKKNDKNFNKPLFTFIPSVAPSSLNNCPKNLSQYYKDDTCLMFLTLRDMSLYILLIDKIDQKVISLERFHIEKRLRHFGLKNNKIYLTNDLFFITADGDGVYSAKFENFR